MGTLLMSSLLLSAIPGQHHLPNYLVTAMSVFAISFDHLHRHQVSSSRPNQTPGFHEAGPSQFFFWRALMVNHWVWSCSFSLAQKTSDRFPLGWQVMESESQSPHKRCESIFTRCKCDALAARNKEQGQVQESRSPTPDILLEWMNQDSWTSVGLKKHSCQVATWAKDVRNVEIRVEFRSSIHLDSQANMNVHRLLHRLLERPSSSPC